MYTAKDCQLIISFSTDGATERMTQQFAKMRNFITEGCRQDRAWAKHFQAEFARTLAIGFNEVHAHIQKIERAQVVPLF